MRTENTPLVVPAGDSIAAVGYVIPTSTGGTSPQLTVHSLFESKDPEQEEQGMTFMRRVFALLVFQYSTVLIVASPFALIEPFQNFIHPMHVALWWTSLACMIGSILLAVAKGAVRPYSRIVIVTLTLSVALQLGLEFEQVSWGDYGLLAVGQATASFALLLALFQFEASSLEWLSAITTALMCLLLSGIWSVILHEVGLSWQIAVVVSFAGWIFCMLNVLQFQSLCKLVASQEYVFATLFILFPQAILYLSSRNNRRVRSN